MGFNDNRFKTSQLANQKGRFQSMAVASSRAVVTSSFTSQLALSLDGVDEHMAWYSPVAAMDAFAFAFWINPQTASLGSTGNYVSIGQSAAIQTLSISPSNTAADAGFNNLTLFASGSSAFSRTTNNPGVLQPNTWTHVIWSWAPTNPRVFINGIKNETTTSAGSLKTFTQTPGHSGTINRVGLGTACNPAIYDEVMFFSRSLTDAEALSLYNFTDPRLLSGGPPVHWWRMGEGSTFPIINNVCTPAITGTLTNCEAGDLTGSHA